MLNQIVVVGRLTKDIEIKETEEGKKYASITLAVPRSFKNTEGVYETDFINFMTFDNIAQNTAEYCHKGDVIGIRGRIQSYTNEEKEIKNELNLVAEKVTFLSSRSHSENEKTEKEQGAR